MNTPSFGFRVPFRPVNCSMRAISSDASAATRSGKKHSPAPSKAPTGSQNLGCMVVTSLRLGGNRALLLRRGLWILRQ